MLVEATQLGYIYNIRVRPGQRFHLKDPKHFSDKWMIKVDSKKKETIEEDVIVSKKGKTKKTPAEVFGALVNTDEEVI